MPLVIIKNPLIDLRIGNTWFRYRIIRQVNYKVIW